MVVLPILVILRKAIYLENLIDSFEILLSWFNVIDLRLLLLLLLNSNYSMEPLLACLFSSPF
jgi:hypothetical protein